MYSYSLKVVPANKKAFAEIITEFGWSKMKLTNNFIILSGPT